MLIDDFIIMVYKILTFVSLFTIMLTICDLMLFVDSSYKILYRI